MPCTFLAGIRDGKISRDDLGVARPLGRSSSSFDEDFFFFFLREPEEEKKTRGVDAYPFGRKSILRRSTLPQVRFFCLSFVIPHLGLRKHVYGPPACVKVYS